MSVWLTPDLRPFIGGTYFPPKDSGRRPGLKTVLTRIMEQVITMSKLYLNSTNTALYKVQMCVYSSLHGNAKWLVGCVSGKDISAVATVCVPLPLSGRITVKRWSQVVREL